MAIFHHYLKMSGTQSYKKVAFVNLILCMLTMISISEARVKSYTGTIHFDSNADGTPEMILNSTGLSVSTNNPTQALEVQGNALVSRSLTIGGNAMGSTNLYIQGSLGFEGVHISANVTLSNSSRVYVNSASDNIFISLPYAGNVLGQEYMIKKMSSLNSVYILCSSGGRIDSSYGMALGVGSMGTLSLISSGNRQWSIVSTYSSNTLWSPSQLNTAVWFDANDSSTITTDSAGNISQWSDKSGNNRHAAQGTDNMRPRYRESGLDGRGTISFDGSDDILNIGGADFLIRSAYAIINANDGTPFSAFNRVLSSPTDPKIHALYAESGAANFISSLPQTGAVSNTFYTDGAESIDFTALSDHKMVGAIGNSDSSARGDWKLGGPANMWNGDIVELITLTTALSTSDRQKLEGYLAWKWGVEIRLSTTHPYRYHPPL